MLPTRAHDLALADLLAFDAHRSAKDAHTKSVTVAVIDDDAASVAAVPAGVHHDAIGCGLDRVPIGAEISTPVCIAPSPENGSLRWP